MCYQYADTEQRAEELVRDARRKGLKAYALCLNVGRYEVRMWQ